MNDTQDGRSAGVLPAGSPAGAGAQAPVVQRGFTASFSGSVRAEQLERVRALGAQEKRREAIAALHGIVWGEPRMEFDHRRSIDSAALDLLPFWIELASLYQRAERPAQAAAVLFHVLPRIPPAQLPAAAASLAQLNLAMNRPAAALAVCGEVRVRLCTALLTHETPVILPEPLNGIEIAALEAALRDSGQDVVRAHLTRLGLPDDLPWPMPRGLARRVPELCGLLALARINDTGSAGAASRWLDALARENPEHPARQLWSGWVDWYRIAQEQGALERQESLHALEGAIAALTAPPTPWLIAAGRAALEAGDAAHAAELLDRAAGALRAVGTPDAELSSQAASAWERAGQPRRAAVHLEELRACTNVSPSLRARAALALARIDPDHAMPLLQDAVAGALAACTDPAGIALVIQALDPLVAAAGEAHSTEALRHWLQEQARPVDPPETGIRHDIDLYLRWIDLCLADPAEAMAGARELWPEVTIESSCILPLARFLIANGTTPSGGNEREPVLALARALEQADDQVALGLARDLAAPLFAAGHAATFWRETIAWLAVHLDDAAALELALADWDPLDPARPAWAGFLPLLRGQPQAATAALEEQRARDPMAAWLLARAMRLSGRNAECVDGCRQLLATPIGPRWKAHAVLEAAQAMWAEGKQQQAIANLEKALLLFPHEKEAAARARRLLARYGGQSHTSDRAAPATRVR